MVAVADSDDDRARLEERLQRAKPEGVTLDPRDLGAAGGDRALRLRLQPRRTAWGGWTPAAPRARRRRRRSSPAAEAAGLPAGADCRVGLGAPSPGWPVAVAQRARGAGGAGRRALHPQRHRGRARRRPRARRPTRWRRWRRSSTPPCRTSSGSRRWCRRWSPPRRATPAPPPEFEATLSADGARAAGRGGDRRHLARRDPELCRRALRPRPGDRHHRDRPRAARRLAGAGAGRRRGAGGAGARARWW